MRLLILIILLGSNYSALATGSNEYLAKAKLLLKQGEQRKALLVFKRVMRKPPFPFQQVKALMGLGTVYAAWEKPSEAKQCRLQASTVLSRLSVSEREQADKYVLFQSNAGGTVFYSPASRDGEIVVIK